MKARVTFKRLGKVFLSLQDGRVLQLSAEVANKLNSGMAWGDTGVLYPDRQTGRWRFRIDASDVLPIEIPRDIITPSSKEYANADI